MRATALVIVSLILTGPGCSDKKAAKTEQESKAVTPAGDAAVAPKKLGRGHPPETFVQTDTTGQLIAMNDTTVFWVERRPDGYFVVGGNKNGGDRIAVAGPVAPIRSLAADHEHVYIAAAPLPGTGEAAVPRGVLAVPVAGGELKKLADEGGVLIADGTRLLILNRGHSKTPGHIVAIDEATGAARELATMEGGFGRADLASDGTAVYWLGDRREDKGSVVVRTGYVQRLLPGKKAPIEIASGFSSPGPHLRIHGDYLYFTAKDGDSRRRLYRVAKAGGTAEPLLDPSWEVMRFAVDDTGIYAYASQRGWKVVRFDPSSGEATVLSSPDAKSISPLFVDRDYVYWGATGAIYRVAKTLPTKDEKP